MSNGVPQILVAVDGSKPSMWALDVGARMAAEHHSELTILHVIVPATLGASEIAAYAGETLEQIRAGGEETLEAARRRVPPTVPTHTALRDGYPAQEIVAMAREIGADFIVIGSRGHGRLAHFILGSIAETVIREAPCPVVSVSHDPNLSSAPRPATEPMDRLPAQMPP